MRWTIRQIFFILIVMALFVMTLRPIADPDFWWHLRTGQLIVQTHSIPHTDLFSFTKAGKPWVTQEWLSELFIYGFFKLGGYGILICLFSAIITVAFMLAYLRCPAETRPYIAGFVLLLGAISAAPTWGVRPQMISLLITSLFLYLLDRYRRDGKYRFLIPLPLITLLWVNFHAGYFLGLVITGIYIVGGMTEIFIAKFLKEEKLLAVPSLNSILILCGSLGVCILAILVNPNGVRIIIYPFQTLTSPSMQQFIQEWFSPDFHKMMWQPMACLILALMGIGMVSKKSISPTNILLNLVFGYAALRSMRNIPLFAITAIPVLSEQVGSVVRIPTTSRALSHLLRLTASILLACVALVISLCFVQVVRNQSKTENEIFPKTAADWLLENKPPGNLFNSYGWGGYLIWRMYPEYQVYIDGRADVYGDNFIFDYMTIYRAEQGWEDKLNGHAVRTVLVESNAPLANMLRQTPPWQIAFTDKASTIFIR
jgi:hypothetical protein